MESSDWIKFKQELNSRFRQFALDIIKLIQTLPINNEGKVIGYQLLKSGTSEYANFRAALRARSKAEYISKLSIVVEEADETELWLELLIESGINNSEHCKKLHAESLELLKIVSHLRKKQKNDI